MLRNIIAIAILLFSSPFLFAQDTPADSSLLRAAYLNAVGAYEQFTGSQSKLYNGIEHITYTPFLRGHGYFQDKQPLNGSVWYDGMLYRNIPMQYDLVKDEVVIVDYNNGLECLTTEKVKKFTVAGHHFVRILRDSSAHRNLSTGFYDLLYEGPSAVLAKRSKAIAENIVDNKLQYDIKEQVYYYVMNNNVYRRVARLNELLNLMNDHRKDVRRFLKKQKIRFRNDHETAIVQAAKYYDSLKTAK